MVQKFACLVILLGILTGCESEEKRAAREAEAAQWMAELEAEDARRELERQQEEAQLEADIAACSTVVDATRCKEAFWCRQNPEDCVYEFGDPSIIMDAELESYDQPNEW